MAAKDKVILRHVTLALAVDKTGTAGSTTLTAAAAAGAGTLTVAAITNFAIGDWIRVGSGETLEFLQVHTVTAPVGSTITLNTNKRKAHVIGEAVVEQTPLDLGSVSQQQGVVIGYRGASENVFVADARLPHAVLNGFVDADCTFLFPNLSLYSLAAAVGALQAVIVGSGTAASPTQLASNGTDFGVAANATLIVVGKLFDGTDLTAYLFGVDADYTGITLPLSRGKFTGLPARFVAAGGGAFDTSVPALAADVTNKPTKGKVFDALVQAGIFIDTVTTPGNSTVASGGGAGVSNVVLASGTNFVAGDWVRFGTGDLMEIWQLETVVTNTLTIRGKFFRSQAVGTVAREQTLTLFPGVDEDGATLALGGSVDVMRSALSRTSIGLRAGSVEATITIPVIETTLANLAYSLGVPQSAISGGRLLTDGSNIGTATDLNGLYLRGTLLDATSWAVIASGTSLDLSQATELTVNNAGKPNTVLVAGKPAGLLAILNYV
jgi:hypothetical protein